jgi:hypothetical protein
MTEATLHCSFCRKSQHDVAKLIAGPGIAVCDECIHGLACIVTGRDSGPTSVGGITLTLKDLLNAPEKWPSRYPDYPDYMDYQPEALISKLEDFLFAWSAAAYEIPKQLEALARMGSGPAELREILKPGARAALDRLAPRSEP